MTARMQFRGRRLATLRFFSRHESDPRGKCKKILHVDIQGLTLSLSTGSVPGILLFAVNSLEKTLMLGKIEGRRRG